jgi:hypothetical protein
LKSTIEFKRSQIASEFVEVCKQQNILNVALFFQCNISYFFQQPRLQRICLAACAATKDDAVINLAKYSFTNLYQFLFSIFDSVHPGSDDVDTDDSSYTLTIDDFRLIINSDSANRLTLLKRVIRYFLLTCQLDSALAIISSSDQRQIVLERATQLEQDKTKVTSYCQCDQSHVAILQHKLSLLPEIDAKLEKAAADGDSETVYLLLDQGGAALRAITGATRRADFEMVMEITRRFNFDVDILVSVLKLLASAKMDELFTKYLRYLQKTFPDWIDIKEDILKPAVENGLVHSTVRLLRDQAAVLSLPIDPDLFDSEVYKDTVPKVCDRHIESILGNIPEKPLHHRAVTHSALQVIKSCNQPDLEKTINEWQMGVEYYYCYIESLIIKDDTNDLIKALNFYGIDYRLALRGATIEGRVDILERLFDALSQSRNRGLLIDTDDAKSFCAFYASRTGKLNVIDYLRIEKLYPRKNIALDAAAAENRNVFVAHFNRADFGNNNSLEGIVYHLGSAGWNDLLLPLIQAAQTTTDQEFLFKRSAKGAITAKNFKQLALLLYYSNFKAHLILHQPSESDLFRLVTLLEKRDRQPAIQSFITAGYTKTDQQSFSKRADAIIKAMNGTMKLSFEEAYACSDVGTRSWFVQGFRARLFHNDIYLLICSFLLGHDAKVFQPKFYFMMQERCLGLFLNTLYGHQNWIGIEKSGNTYYQQKAEGGKLKKRRSEMDPVALQPYNTRLNRNLFYRPPPPASTKGKNKPGRELVHKSVSPKQ